MTVLFIVNPLSAKVAKTGSSLERLYRGSKTFTSHDISLHIIGKDGDFNAQLSLSKNKPIKHIFIEGGDGTVQNVLTGFIRANAADANTKENFPNFTLIPGGMTNQIAKNIGLKNRSDNTIIAALKNNNLKERPTAMLEVQQGDTRHYGFLFSTGAVPMITAFTKSKLHKRGIGGSLAVAGGIIRGISGQKSDVLNNTDISLQSGPHDLNETHLGTLVTTLPGLILNLDPFTGKEDAPLRVLYAGENARHLPRNAAGLWLGRKDKDRTKDGILSWNAHILNYRYDGPTILDGEEIALQGKPFEIKATQPLTFVY